MACHYNHQVIAEGALPTSWVEDHRKLACCNPQVELRECKATLVLFPSNQQLGVCVRVSWRTARAVWKLRLRPLPARRCAGAVKKCRAQTCPPPDNAHTRTPPLPACARPPVTAPTGSWFRLRWRHRRSRVAAKIRSSSRGFAREVHIWTPGVVCEPIAAHDNASPPVGNEPAEPGWRRLNQRRDCPTTRPARPCLPACTSNWGQPMKNSCNARTNGPRGGVKKCASPLPLPVAGGGIAGLQATVHEVRNAQSACSEEVAG